MAFYKEPCIHCGAYIDRDSEFCPKCGSRSPFIAACPSCLREIRREDMICAGCGRPLYIPCPQCKKATFVQDKCEQCGVSLLVRCSNPRCGSMQFFQNIKCTACGKKMK